MKVKYDQEVDILIIQLSEGEIVESDESKPGIIMDYDKDGNLAKFWMLPNARNLHLNLSTKYGSLRPSKI